MITTVASNPDAIGYTSRASPPCFGAVYRVDRSHSKETGDTGFELSIVKHAVSYLGGTIRLESTVGVGTTVLITFSDSDVNI